MTIGNYISSTDIYDAQGLKEQVLNYTDWAGLYKTPTSFALMSSLGSIGTVNNPEVMMNEIEGIPRRAKAVANFSIAGEGSTGTIDLDTITGNILKNEYIRVGNLIRINGFDVDDEDDRETTLIRIINKVGTTLTYKTIAASNTTTGISFVYNARGGAYLHVSTAEDLKGSAPEGLTVYPSQRKNWVQLYRFTYAVDSDTESADKYFGDMRYENMNEMKDMLYGAINHDLLFSMEPVKPNALEGTIKGSGDNVSFMGGLPYLLGTSDLSASNTIYHSISSSDVATDPLTNMYPVTTAQARTFLNGLYDWADKFKNVGGTLYALTSKAMRSFLRQSVAYTGDALIKGKLSLPSLSIYYDELDLGDIKIKLLVDDDLSSGSAPYITDGTNFVTRNYFMMALDMPQLGMMYRNRVTNESGLGGIMAPKVVPVGQIRNALSYEAEWVAELTCGLKRQDRNGVFFIYDEL